MPMRAPVSGGSTPKRSRLDALLILRRSQREADRIARRAMRLRTVIACTLIALAAITVARKARAADWLLMRKLPNQEWQQRGPALDQQTACLTALASDGFVVPKGTLLRCERAEARQ